MVDKTFRLDRLLFAIALIQIGIMLIASIWILTTLSAQYYVFLLIPMLWIVADFKLIDDYPTIITVNGDQIAVQFLRKKKLFLISKAVSVKEHGNMIVIRFTDGVLFLNGVHQRNTAIFDLISYLKSMNIEVDISRYVSKLLRKYSSAN